MKTNLPAQRLLVATLAERPELRAQLFSAEFAAAVPEFLRHDPTASLYYADDALDRYLDFALVAVHPDEPDRVIARALSVPFVFRDGSGERAELPSGGWDAVIGWADRDWRTGRRPNAVSALEIMVLPPYRGRGLAQSMLAAMCANTRARGFADLYGPLRPATSTRNRAFRSPITWRGPAATGCRRIPGCACMSAPAARSSRSRPAAW